ncbi:GDSL esterase/lipase At2g40250 [Gastrolobium bilobum]|uniref:GDSL esterase/lipase At2g40250 n=1 Tax=Gastrolobium bilobum TaxID=150636 RepID=UPI002AB0BF59|nr:GDSL esterase/lipase At2g40250 [Gastrolobium bilobum]
MASITIRASSFFLVFSLVLFLSIPNSATATHPVSAVFAFGDSTIDSGNNNRFNTLFRGDHLPYGRDFSGHIPTGRFSNGKIATDYLTQILGVKEVLPAYLDPHITDHDLLTGVSFGSGGSGLDINTATLTRVMDLNAQFELFEEALMRMRRVVGVEKANEIIENALFVISTGTNDMLYNAYLLPTRIIRYGSISGYQDFLLQNLHSFIQRLYGAGARRIMVAGLPPIGCLPIQVTINSILPSQHWLQRVCNVQQNVDSEAYNTKLQSHVRLLQTILSGAKVAYFDIYTPILDMVLSPTKYGFQQALQGCCGTGLIEMGPVCNVLDLTCSDPSKYLFWDAVHLTQTGYYFLAESGRQHLLPYFTS